MDLTNPEKLIKRISTNLANTNDPLVQQKCLESFEQCLGNDIFFQTALTATDLLDLVVNIFVTSITEMANISQKTLSAKVISKKILFSTLCHFVIMMIDICYVCTLDISNCMHIMCIYRNILIYTNTLY